MIASSARSRTNDGGRPGAAVSRAFTPTPWKYGVPTITETPSMRRGSSAAMIRSTTDGARAY